MRWRIPARRSLPCPSTTARTPSSRNASATPARRSDQSERLGDAARPGRRREGVCYRRRMTPDRHVDRLMEKLLRAIEVSLKATEASRDAVQEILKRGAETGIFFAGTKSTKSVEGFELTEQDRDFLRSLSIRPDPRS